jgi:hypothetical protein
VSDGHGTNRPLALRNTEPAGYRWFIPEQSEEATPEALVDGEELQRHRRKGCIDEPVGDGPVPV